jgi:L-lactate dehydrogenase complex protein LldE
MSTGGERGAMIQPTAALMVTCLGDVFYPEVGVRIVRLLRGLGIRVDFPAGQTCCGLPLLNSGYRAEASAVAARTVPLFGRADHVVVPSGSCAWMIKHEYPALVPASLRAQAEQLAGKAFELSQYLVDVLGVTRLGSAMPGRVTYHDSCHLLRGLGEARTPRALLGGLPGVEFVELPRADECCGFGGSFSVRLPEVSAAILDRKVASIEATGADRVVACDAGCLMQIGGALSRKGSRVRAVHLAEVLVAPGEPPAESRTP